MSNRRKQRLMLIAVFALFFIPVLTAWVLRINPVVVNTVNLGTLIEPPRLMDASHLSVLHELNPGSATFQEVWTVLIPHNGACEATCEATLKATQVARIAINKDFDRVQRLLVGPVPLEETRIAELIEQHPDLAVAVAKPQWMKQLTEAEPASVWLVDPRSFQFMYYPKPLDPKSLLKDLKRLLKISKVD